MSYSTYLTVTLATILLGTPNAEADGSAESTPPLDDLLDSALQPVRALAESYCRGPLSPLAAAQFEKDLDQALRAMGRVITEWTYNDLEPAAVEALPAQVYFEGNQYRRLPNKTPQQLSTLFGTITLRRLGYRAAADIGEPVLFPLCRTLGVVQGTTPALRECVAQYQAESGATQKRTLQRLQRQHGVNMGVKRLRQLTDFVAAAMEEQRAPAQAEQVVRWLEQAEASRGRHRPGGEIHSDPHDRPGWRPG